MSADRLNRVVPADEAVLRVPAGQPMDDVARRAGMDAAALGDAIELFSQTGRDALADQAERSTWWQFYLEFPDWRQAEATAAAVVRPVLFDAEAKGGITAWWYTRKHPCWRLRLGIHPDPGAKAGIRAALDDLVDAGHLQRWWPGIYEPEIAAFGGAASMEAAHYLFVADSREILALADHSDMPIGRRELSVLLCTIMMRAAGLEWYEQGDVWHRVIGEEHRSALEGVPEERLIEMTTDLRRLLLSHMDPDSPLFAPGGPLEPVQAWAAAFRDTGVALAEAVKSASLERGLRRILAYHVIFHWNRLGLSISTQSALAHASRTAILDPPVWS
ncbi:thiopeptide-type bacteriocin biosynthesis protein [Streptomyces sp. NPDC054794]